MHSAWLTLDHCGRCQRGSPQVRAFVLEPLAGDTTWLVLDGEQVPRDKPLFVEVHPRLCTVLVHPSWAAPPLPSIFPA